MSHKPLETSIISILFSLFQSIPGYDEGIQFRVISILFSLFQSNSSNAAKNVNEGRFPYYLVYFKANRNRRTKRDRRSISILFSLFQSLEEVTKFFSNKKEFPYYLVYFKALLPQGCGYVWYLFPYYLVYFKALMSLRPSSLREYYFHTI